jgi:hypothetical protein
MPKKKESDFDKLARLIKEEGDDIRSEVRDQIGDGVLRSAAFAKRCMKALPPSTAASTRSFRRSSTNTLDASKSWRPPSFQSNLPSRSQAPPQPTPSTTSQPSNPASRPPPQEQSSSRLPPQSSLPMPPQPPPPQPQAPNSFARVACVCLARNTPNQSSECQFFHLRNAARICHKSYRVRCETRQPTNAEAALEV